MSEAPAPSRIAEGDVLCNRFRLVRALDREGASQLWLAEDSELRERVALRILESGSQARQERMRSVCRKVRRLRHPHVVPVYDFYRDGELALVARAYVEGGSISAWRGLTRAQLVEKLAPVVDALAHAHAEGIIHGDLKPSKLLVDGSGTPLLADFELSGVLSDQLDPEREPGPAEAQLQAADRAALASLGLEILDPGDQAARASLEAALASSGDAQAFEPFLRNDTHEGGDRDLLVPVQLRAHPRTSLPAGLRQRDYRIAAAGGVLALLLIGVLFALPRWVERDSRSADEHGSGAASGEPVDGAEARRRAAPPAPGAAVVPDGELNRLLGELLNRRQALTERGVEVWAAEAVASVDSRISEGEAAQLASDSALAATHYRGALEGVAELEARAESVRDEALAAGTAALEAQDIIEARRQFELAALSDPGNPEAAAGLARAEALQNVLALTETGEQHEQRGELESARDAFDGALTIDAEWDPALRGRERVELELRANAYDEAMALAVSSLASKDLGEADEQVRKALALEPGSAEARDLAQRIAQERLAVFVAAGRRRAEAHEAKEEWSAATAEYRKLLDRDSDLAFAKTGLERSEWRASVSKRFDAWIASPALLFDEATRVQARETLLKAREVDRPGPKLRHQIAEVSDIERVASTPMKIVFESDGLTEVRVSRVGGLGTFARREVPLKPGRYVVQGVRRGFRDVRKTVEVIPGRTPPRVDVRCAEEI